jgi:carbamoyltransferase
LKHSLINNFEKETGRPVLLNTSFNIMGQPIVERPLEALANFYSCGIDALVIGNWLIEKNGY